MDLENIKSKVCKEIQVIMDENLPLVMKQIYEHYQWNWASLVWWRFGTDEMFWQNFCSESKKTAGKCMMQGCKSRQNLGVIEGLPVNITMIRKKDLKIN